VSELSGFCVFLEDEEWSVSELSGFCVFLEDDSTDLRENSFRGLGGNT